MRLVKNHRVQPAPLVTLRPKYGMLMTLERRQRQDEAVAREESWAAIEKGSGWRNDSKTKLR